jgi:hypothetical protein
VCKEHIAPFDALADGDTELYRQGVSMRVVVHCDGANVSHYLDQSHSHGRTCFQPASHDHSARYPYLSPPLSNSLSLSFARFRLLPVILLPLTLLPVILYLSPCTEYNECESTVRVSAQ